MEAVIESFGELAPGEHRAVSLEGRSLLVFRHADGTYSALKNCCSHAEVPLAAGRFEDGTIECPAHGAKFDARTGRHLCMPAVKGVAAFKVTAIDGTLVVSLPD